ncbi:MAG: endolytic transglycosylase MltG [Patescibacteria group bacterium]
MSSNQFSYVSGTVGEPQPKKKSFGLLFLLFVIILLIGGFFYLQRLATPPADFPLNTLIEVVPGSSISAITKQFEQAGVVRSDLLLYFVLLTSYEPEDVKASTYVFTEPYDVYAIAAALVRGDFDSLLVPFIHREGEPVKEIAVNASAQLTDFSAEEFMNLASTSEGVLFPETYRIPKTFTPTELFTLMTEMYEEKIAPLRELMRNRNLIERDVVILASIIEREANSADSMKLVSGILQNRLLLDMPLQVDASMEYILEKPLKELTAEDLKIDTPYNTYLYRGLPPTAIGNPGMEAIMAVLEPTPSEYMFYITGNDGQFYYAKDFDGHRQNIARYLK